MRILLVHNYYDPSKPSGENRVFEAEKNLLEKMGNEVRCLIRNNTDIISKGFLGKIEGALVTPWNPFIRKAVSWKIADFKPDIVHVHNIFPLISPSIFRMIGNQAVRVLTLHNYRIFCAAAMPLRGNQICTECMDRHSSLPSLKYGCYRNSRIATLPLAFSIALHRGLGTWEREVDAFIALSDFQKEIMGRAGLPKGKVYVKPNFCSGRPNLLVWEARSKYVVFVGRLSAEKGVNTLLDAWEKWGRNAPELRIIGDGPLKTSLKKKSVGLNVKFLGQVSQEEVRNQISFSWLLILPAQWFEGFPMVIAEAFAFGTPVAASEIGPLPSIVVNGTNGVTFKPFDPESLLGIIRDAWTKPGLLEKLGKGARESFEQKYNEETNYGQLIDIYEKAIASKKAMKEMA